MNRLHPGARWVFRLNAYSRFLTLIAVLIWIRFVFSTNNVVTRLLGVSWYILFGSFILLMVIVGEIYSRMSYPRWLYEVNDDGAKVEHGIIWKKYTSIPFERVQNVDIRRGVIARMFGFSTVEIETAGSSAAMQYRRGRRGYKSEGHLPAIGIEDAEKMREFVMKKIKKNHKDSGI